MVIYEGRTLLKKTVSKVERLELSPLSVYAHGEWQVESDDKCITPRFVKIALQPRGKTENFCVYKWEYYVGHEGALGPETILRE